MGARLEAQLKVIVVGGGITGLTAAHELKKRGVDVVTLESASRPGGKVQSARHEGVDFELGPDSFIAYKPEAIELIKELGLGADLLPAGPDKRVGIVFGGKLRELPLSLLPFLRTDMLDWKEKARLFAEPFIGAGPQDKDESVAAFFRRRLGGAASRRIVEPMLGGVYASDPEKLSLRAAFPQFLEMERRGGLLRGHARRPTASAFVTLKGGLSRLTDALAEKVQPRLGVPVSEIRRVEAGWEVKVGEEVLKADAVIAAVPAAVLAQLTTDYRLSHLLGDLPVVSTAVVTLAYDKQPLSGFGFLVARGEPFKITGATFVSSKFPGRLPDDVTLVRCFMGGAGREADVEGADDQTLMRSARQELKQLLNLGDAHPRWTRVTRWSKANPQYTLGHHKRLKEIEACCKGGLILAGAAFYGVGLPDCIRSGKRSAELAIQGASRRSHAHRR
jgi:oxygen-dependent protoporphyrinogen oxidase